MLHETCDATLDYRIPKDPFSLQLMHVALTQALLVLLIGIYLVRTTWFLFTGVFSVLTPVAGIVLLVCLFAFNRPPMPGTVWFYIVLATYLIGAVANLSLLFSSSPTYSNSTNYIFSWVSMLSFAVLGAMHLWLLFRPNP
jgi:hypothetical protein